MTNYFNILWFEDDTIWFTMESKKLTRELQNTYGFKTEIKREIGVEYNPDELKSENKYDIILMDYKLAAGNTGEKMVDLIRKNAVLTDVVLYSSHYGEMTDALKEDSPMIDGVFFADRKSELFEEKLLAVINKIVRRSEDIVNLRGFFLDNTSDFEVRIKELLKIAWDKLPNYRDELSTIMTTALDNSVKNRSDDIETIKKQDDIYNAANNESEKFIISIAGRLTILSSIIKYLIDNKVLIVPREYDEIRDFKTHYIKEINTYRTALSHKKYSDTSIIVNNRVVTVDEKLHQKLRERITRFDILLSYLEEKIASI